MTRGLVLEGGGLRGAYTAGALAWFLKEGIKFDYGVGISSGAQHLCNYVMGDVKYLEDIAVTIGVSEFRKGLYPLITEGQIVGYNRLFDYALQEVAPMDLDSLYASEMEAEIGIFDVKAGKTRWVNKNEIDPSLQMLKAALLIPIAGRPVKIDGIKYIDAGIEHMIPIERAVEKKIDKSIVITTKPQTYERSDTGWPTKLYMALFYHPHKKFRELIRNRRDIYYLQKQLVDDLVKEEKALELFPTKSFEIGRFGGDFTQLKALFDLGFNDTEARREEIYKFLELE